MVKISDLPQIDNPTGDETVVALSGGSTVRIFFANLISAIATPFVNLAKASADNAKASELNAASAARQVVKSMGLTLSEGTVDGVFYPLLVLSDSATPYPVAALTTAGKPKVWADPTTDESLLKRSYGADTSWLMALDDRNSVIHVGIDAQEKSLYVRDLVTDRRPLADVNHVIVLSQSLGTGVTAQPLRSTSDTKFGGLMFGKGVNTWDAAYMSNPAGRPNSDFALVPLVASIGMSQDSSTGETLANGLADMFKSLVHPMVGGSRDQKPNILVSCAGFGGRYLYELDKAHDYGNPANNAGQPSAEQKWGFYAALIDDVRRAKAWCDANGKTYQVWGIVWDQGQSGDADRKLYRNGAAYATNADYIAAYVAGATQLFADIRADVQAVTNQAFAPPILIPQVGGFVTGQADLNLMGTVSDCYVVGPRYQMPTAENSVYSVGGVATRGLQPHITADGERWWGCYVGAALYDINVRRRGCEPLRMMAAQVDPSNKAVVYIGLNKPGVVLDTTTLPIAGVNYGLQVLQVGTSQAISKFEVLTGDPNSSNTLLRAYPSYIRLTLASALSASSTVRYGGNSQIGVSTKTVTAVDTTGTILVTGTATPVASTALTIAGDNMAQIWGYMVDGAVRLISGSKRLVVRSVALVSGNTVITGETRDTTGTWAVGDVFTFARFANYGNVRDSGGTSRTAPYGFAGDAISPRTGLYPMHNWLVQQDGLSIAGI